MIRAYLKWSLLVGASLGWLAVLMRLANAPSTSLNVIAAVMFASLVFAWGYYARTRVTTRRRSSGRGPRIIGAILLLVCAVGSSNCATRIDAGTVGIKIDYAGTYRGVQDIPLRSGWVFYWPLSSEVLSYPVYVKNVVWTRSTTEGNPVDEEITFTNADQMTISVDVSLAYHIEPDKVPSFYLKFRNDDLNSFTMGYMRNVARDMFNAHAGRYHVEDIMGDNAAFLADVRKSLQTDVGQYGVIIDQFGIIGAPRPPQPVIEAITLKVQAQQLAVQKQNELAQAQADAAKRVAAADGDAKAAVLKAQGEAQANKLLTESLSDKLLAWRALEIQSQSIAKWNGTLPSVTGGVMPMLQLPSTKPGGGGGL